MDKVLVTGATGFIALHCIQQLLDQGFEVRGTVRTENRKNEVMDAMKKHSSNGNNLEIVFTDLLKQNYSLVYIHQRKYQYLDIL